MCFPCVVVGMVEDDKHKYFIISLVLGPESLKTLKVSMGVFVMA